MSIKGNIGLLNVKAKTITGNYILSIRFIKIESDDRSLILIKNIDSAYFVDFMRF